MNQKTVQLRPVVNEIRRQVRDFIRQNLRHPTHVYLGDYDYKKLLEEVPRGFVAQDFLAEKFEGLIILLRFDEGVHVVWDGSNPA